MKNTNSHSEKRQLIRRKIREKRNNLSMEVQKTASERLIISFLQHVPLPQNARIGCYLSNDGELNTSLLIQELWSKNHAIYLPIIHPFNSTNLLFQKYEKTSPMKANRYGILEPKLNCSEVCPVSQLDILLLPVVAFDSIGNRMGMGGGYYDRTLSSYYRDKWPVPKLIGLAHDCQKVERLPTEAWDVPLQAILTPTTFYHW